MKKKGILLLILALVLLSSACQKECEHEYSVEIITPASCTQEGQKQLTCIHCQEISTQIVPMLEHKYEAGLVEREPSCAEEGIQQQICQDCGAIHNEPIAKLEHTFGDKVLTKEPNCSEEGAYSADCMVCGQNHVVETIPQNDVHNFENMVLREPTCTDPGEGKNVCTLCQYEEPCVYALKEHTYENAEALLAATCTTDGKQKLTCKDCGYTKEEPIYAFGHSWHGATCLANGVCSNCGAVGNRGGHAYVVTKDIKATQSMLGRFAQTCQTCGNVESYSYGVNYRYDINVMRNTLIAYAQSLGLNVEHKDIYQSSDYKFIEAYPLFDLYSRGQDYLIQNFKQVVDWVYKDCQKSGNYNIIMCVYDRGTSGIDTFGIIIMMAN